MTKLFKRICIWALCLILLSLCTGLCVAADEDVSYMAGEEIQIPQHTFLAGGSEVTAVALIHTPSGVVYKAEDSFVAQEEGLYRIEYIAYDAQGVLYSKTVEFTVDSALCSVGTSRSAVSFGKHSYGNYTINRHAVLASIVSTDKFSYTPIVDLRELTEESFLEFFVIPEKIGINDTGKINITLTDLYDPENFVTITVKKGVSAQAGAAWAERTSYITANAAHQQPTGLERGKGDWEIDDNLYTLHKGDVWGANIAFALPGNPGYVSLEEPNDDPDKVGTQTLAFRFDLNNNILYANNQLVTMLSDSLVYGADIWSGFTTGECLLSIEGSDYNAGSLNLAITKLGANSVADAEQVFASNLFADTAAPVITVDIPEGGAPHGVAQMPYGIFPASAKDDYSGEVAVSTAVYLYYGTPKQLRVNVKDGSFIPFAAGEYTLVYTAADRYGNAGKSEIFVTVEPENSAALEVMVSQPKSGSAGQIYDIAVPVFANNRGEVQWSATAVCENGSVYEITAETPCFFPEYAGSYTLRYDCNDYIYQKTLELSLQIEKNGKPVFFEEPVLPQTLIYGCIYTLPQIDARLYASGEAVQYTPEIYVIEDGGAERKADYRFVTYAKDTCQIIYRAVNDGQITEYCSNVIPVKDVGYNGTYQIVEYFDNDGMVSQVKPKSIRFVPEGDGSEPCSTTFINPVQTFDFAIRFAGAGRGFEKINLYLTDPADDSVAVKFTYRQNRGAVYFSINDAAESRLAGVVFNDPDAPLALNVQNNGCTVLPTGTTALSYSVETDLQGRPFAGFAGSWAYLRVEIEQVTRLKQTGVDIFSICGQMISGIYVDNIKPMISATAAAGARPCGSEFVIPAVYYADVLDPSAKCQMYVLAPDGSYAVSKGNVLLDTTADPSVSYVLPLIQHGSYNIHYTVTDTSGNELVYSYVINSADVIAPDVQILSPVTTGKVNAQIPVAQIQITDNYDTALESFTVYAYVVTPNDQTYGLLDTSLKQTGSFTVEHAGVYTVKYMVMDSTGNMTIASYQVAVE